MEKKFKTGAGKYETLSLYLSKIDKTNPIEFHVKNNYFYDNANIIVFSQSGTEKKSHLDVLSEKLIYSKKKFQIDDGSSINNYTRKSKEESPTIKINNILQQKLTNKDNSQSKKNIISRNNIYINTNYSAAQKSQTNTFSSKNFRHESSKILKSKDLRKKNANELFEYFSAKTSSNQTLFPSLHPNVSLNSTSKYLTNTNSNFKNKTSFSKLNKNDQIEGETINLSKSKINFNKIESGNLKLSKTEKKIHNSRIKLRRKYSEDYLKTKSSFIFESKLSLHEISKLNESYVNKSNVISNNMNSTRGDKNTKTSKKKIKMVNDTVKEFINEEMNNIPNRFKKQYPELVKKFNNILEYKSKIDDNLRKNEINKLQLENKLDDFIKKSDKNLLEFKEHFFKQDKIFRSRIKQLLYKTLKYEFKKEIAELPTYLETLRPTVELKEYQYLKKIKPKFKKLGNIKILIIPKELKKERKNDQDIIFKDKRVVDTVRNAYSKEKTTSMKERRFIDKLSIPRNPICSNKFITGFIKTCDFIENENIIVTNKIKKTSKKLSKKLDFISHTSKEAYLVTK